MTCHVKANSSNDADAVLVPGIDGQGGCRSCHVGEGGAKVAAVTGETPNLAARLQAFAPPNQIVIADGTRRQVGNAFKLAEMGNRDFKGFAEPVPIYLVSWQGGLDAPETASETASDEEPA
mgnify:CR=1 FL=1